MEATLGKRITTNRKRLGLTQDQLAEKLGITAQAVSKWENDLSCPDISILPKLADIFGITTDELLGREKAIPICEAEVAKESDNAENSFTFDNGKMDFHWEGAKLEGIGLACWVILMGLLYLVTQLTSMDISFWNILWPSFLLVFGLFGLYPKFSAFRLGCAIFGGYFLIGKLDLLPIQLNNGVLIAVIIVLFGLGLLVDALRKSRHPKFTASYTDKNGNVHHGKLKNNFTVEGNCFDYSASFGSSTQYVQLEKLKQGDISTSFGEFTVDLSGIGTLDENASLDVSCNFGELTLLIPSRFRVRPDSSTAFASFEIEGHPDEQPQGHIALDASANFSEICIRYI